MRMALSRWTFSWCRPLSLNKDAPVPRGAERAGNIVCRPILGGLHHQYARILFAIRTGPRLRSPAKWRGFVFELRRCGSCPVAAATFFLWIKLSGEGPLHRARDASVL
jgi:hypothetical protein